MCAYGRLSLKIQTITDSFDVPDQDYIENIHDDNESNNIDEESNRCTSTADRSDDSATTCASFMGLDGKGHSVIARWNAEEEMSNDDPGQEDHGIDGTD